MRQALARVRDKHGKQVGMRLAPKLLLGATEYLNTP
jgi:hypothetical protein